jgi:hypothetical protein
MKLSGVVVEAEGLAEAVATRVDGVLEEEENIRPWPSQLA